MDTEMLTREQIIRARSRREKRERWRVIRDLILSHGEQHYLDFWARHWPPDKHSMGYSLGKDSSSLRRHVRIECHYLRLPVERQEALEPIIWG